MEIQVNESAIEPNEYFKILKGQTKNINEEALQSQLTTIGEHILSAKEVGQKNFLERLAFTYDVITKEQKLLASGYDTYVYKDDIKAFLDNVTPKNSIKIIELERYPRAIPLDVMKKLEAAKKDSLFDDFVIVFTDFTGEAEAKTKEEKEFIKKNKDPIVFGFFVNKSNGLKHDRFYYIADWEDEHCDLTFSKMLDKMAGMKLEGVDKKIGVDDAYLQEIVHNTLASSKPQFLTTVNSTMMVAMPAPEPKPTFWEKFFSFGKKAA